MAASEGLSPRVWGNPEMGYVHQSSLGPIPTCVGQPQGQYPDGISGLAYPHVCGATGPWLVMMLGCRGLSPRVWGNLDVLSNRIAD